MSSKKPFREIAYVDWHLHVGDDGKPARDDIKTAALLAILDELRQLNRTLNCPNFLAIPRELRAIKRHVSRIRKTRAAKINRRPTKLSSIKS